MLNNGIHAIAFRVDSFVFRLLREKAQDEHGDDKGEREEYEYIADACRCRAGATGVLETMHAGEQIIKIMDEIFVI